MLYIPEGMAHGFQTLRDETEVFYQISEFYSPEMRRRSQMERSSVRHRMADRESDYFGERPNPSGVCRVKRVLVTGASGFIGRSQPAASWSRAGLRFMLLRIGDCLGATMASNGIRPTCSTAELRGIFWRRSNQAICCISPGMRSRENTNSPRRIRNGIEPVSN